MQIRVLTHTRCLTVLALLCVSATTASAQPEGPSLLEFNFSNPGARSLALAGAFAGLADDATAVFANPAGLVQLARPEVSLEFRRWGYATPFIEGGRFSGSPTGLGLDTMSGSRVGVSNQQLAGVSFFSVALPRDRFTLAFHGHQVANFELEARRQGMFTDDLETARSYDAGFVIDGTLRLAESRNVTRLEMFVYGLTGAVRVTETVSVGGGLNRYSMSFRNTGQAYGFSPATLPQGPYGPATLDEAVRLATTVAVSESSDWQVSGGFLWQVAPGWRVGGFYRGAPLFGIRGTETTGPALTPVPVGTVVKRAVGTVGLPGVYGLGTAYQSGPLTLSAEWDRVGYSTFIETLDLEPVANVEDIDVDDASQVRVGGEWVFTGLNPIVAVRGGAWFDPDHRVRSTESAIARALFPAGDDHWHGTAGVGVAFATFQIDVGVDLSEERDTLSLSTVYSF
ncbi:MAG: hypothetical protein V3T48_03505 [Vicinamibacterales bacterium]